MKKITMLAALLLGAASYAQITLDTINQEGRINTSVDNADWGGGVHTPEGNPSVSFSADFTSVAEDGASVDVEVTINQAPVTNGSVDVNILAGGSAVEGVDFSFLAAETLVFPSGSTASQTVTIPILNDNDDNSDVFFLLQLENEVDLQISGDNVFGVYILDDDTVVPAGDNTQLDINYLTSYLVDGSGTAEISAYDPITQQIIVTNGDKIEFIDFSDPLNMSTNATVDLTGIGDGVQSVSVSNGIYAVAIAANEATDNGFVLIADVENTVGDIVEVGSLPDMLTFSPDGNSLLVANEGEPNDDYSIDPEGSVSVIDVSAGAGNISQADVTTLDFNAFDSQQAALEAAGVRIYGPGASVSQDLEPEYITVSSDNLFAYVALQENNAYAIVDLTTLEITDVISFGLKDHSLAENSLDVSDETDFIFDATWPIYGMYMPDAIAFYEVGGTGYIVTANEGDAREYDTYEEERKIDDGDYTLDGSVFSNIDILELETNLAEINVTNASGDIDNDGEFEEIHVFGGRSFSIFEAATGTLVYDSGNDFEVITANDPTYGAIFNASNSNNNFKNRSDNKGPEPEGVIVEEIDGEFYAFVLLERIGGMMVYNITEPTAPVFLEYENNRDNTPGGNESGDLGPEGVLYINPADSPTDKGLIVISNEVSATLGVYSIDNNILSVGDSQITETGFVMYPNPATGQIFFSEPGSYKIYDITGRRVLEASEVAFMDISSLRSGTYIVSNSEGVTKKLIVK
ncbi:choice-of-anchor I family protein [Aureitalea sp. L0-47]|uniref:choice-of-anchor I family protein n=1 Tax=Aureitalea sp. L0-47 TaxID=2816962 RepID=UPI0022386E0D|nr:choice-of-anchor I family protein [Aureitalea sp. L0-47]MCW5519567.1 choice-of-anchor I family protein [Aureitalea sp. L0-47]